MNRRILILLAVLVVVSSIAITINARSVDPAETSGHCDTCLASSPCVNPGQSCGPAGACTCRPCHGVLQCARP